MMSKAMTTAERNKKRAEVRRVRMWEQAFSKLADDASPAAEMTWIRNHPAMGRLETNPLGRVVLDLKDIADAPSKGAVHALQHWANNPKEFHKQVLSEHKKSTKQTDDGDFEEVNELPEIVAIDELLMALDCAVNPEDENGNSVEV